MADLITCLDEILNSQTTVDYLNAKEALEAQIYEADVIALAMFREHLEEFEENTDVEELIAFLERMDDGEEDLQFPEFSQTKGKMTSRMRATLSKEEIQEMKLQCAKAPLQGLFLIMEKIQWWEKFKKMQIIHKWFMLSISDVEIVEREEVKRDTQMDLMTGILVNSLSNTKNIEKKSPAKNILNNKQDLKKFERTANRRSKRIMRPWIHLWRIKAGLSHKTRTDRIVQTPPEFLNSLYS